MIPLSRVVSVSLLRYAVCASLAWSNAALAQSLSPDCDMGEQTTMPLKWTDDMRPIGEAIINGTPVPAMISTAAADSAILNKKILDRLGVPVRTSQSVMFPENIRNPTGIYSVLDVSFAVLDDFSFGAARRKNVMYQVEDFMDDTFGVRIGAANLLYTDLESPSMPAISNSSSPRDASPSISLTGIRKRLPLPRTGTSGHVIHGSCSPPSSAARTCPPCCRPPRPTPICQRQRRSASA